MIGSQQTEARSPLPAALLLLFVVSLLAAGFLLSTRQLVLAKRLLLARDQRSDFTALGGVWTPFSVSLESMPEIRVEPFSLTLPREKNVLPEAIVVAEIGAKRGVQDVTLFASRVRDSSGRKIAGDFVFFEPNGFNLAAGATQAVTLSLSADPPLLPGR